MLLWIISMLPGSIDPTIRRVPELFGICVVFTQSHPEPFETTTTTIMVNRIVVMVVIGYPDQILLVRVPDPRGNMENIVGSIRSCHSLAAALEKTRSDARNTRHARNKRLVMRVTEHLVMGVTITGLDIQEVNVSSWA
jgi:hypothetical protein